MQHPGTPCARGAVVAHYSFHKDLEQSKVAVNAVIRFLSDCGYDTRETDKEEQIKGDLACKLKPSKQYVPDDTEEFVEVKYDIMSEKTGNLCFEVYNGAGRPTGILRTMADEIYYVVKENGHLRILGFDAVELRAWIFNPENHAKSRLVSGGDGGKYKMLLVKRDEIATLAHIDERVKRAKLQI